MSGEWRAANVARARAVAQEQYKAARAELARRIPALLEQHKSLTAAAEAAGVTRAVFRRAAQENGVSLGSQAPVSDAERARLAKIAARREDMARRLPGLMKEHGSLQKVSAAAGVSREWLTRIAVDFDLQHLLRTRPGPKPAPKPVLVRHEVAVPLPCPVAVTEEYRPPQSSQRQVQALNLLRRGRDTTDVMRETNLPLREVYRLQAEVREERRARQREGMRA